MSLCAGRKLGKPTYAVKYSTAPFGFAVTRVSANASTPPLFTTNSFPLIFKASSNCLLKAFLIVWHAST